MSKRSGSGSKRTGSKAAAKKGKSPARKRVTKRGVDEDAIPVRIVSVEQDFLSWGGYVQLDPVLQGGKVRRRSSSGNPLDEIFLLEVSWPGVKLKAPKNLKAGSKYGGKALYFLIAARGNRGDKVYLKFLFSDLLPFKESMLIKGKRLSDGTEIEETALEVVHPSIKKPQPQP